MPLGLDAAAAHKGSVKELAKLMERGAPVNVGDYDRRTALHLAASEGNLEVVKYLVDEAKANHSPQDRWGNTPLDDAHRGSHAAVAAFLEGKHALKSEVSFKESREILRARRATMRMETSVEPSLLRRRIKGDRSPEPGATR